MKPCDNLKGIHFEGLLLPNDAQLLDLAARLCPVSEEVRHGFTRLTTCAGVEDARTVVDHCSLLRARIQKDREFIAAELGQGRDSDQTARILGTWKYSLDTMIQQARASKTCSWTVEGGEDVDIDDSEGGEISWRRL